MLRFSSLPLSLDETSEAMEVLFFLGSLWEVISIRSCSSCNDDEALFADLRDIFLKDELLAGKVVDVDLFSSSS